MIHSAGNTSADTEAKTNNLSTTVETLIRQNRANEANARRVAEMERRDDTANLLVHPFGQRERGALVRQQGGLLFR